MDPETTTNPATQEPGVETPTTQPEEQPGAAEQTPDPEPTTSTTSTDEPVVTEPAITDNSTDDDITAWAEKKGIDLSTSEGQAKALRSMRESEKKMRDYTRQASELSKQLQTPVQVDSDSPIVQELADQVAYMQRTQSVSDFQREVALTADQEKTMAEYLVSNPDKVQLVNAGYMSLKDVYQLSGANTSDPSAIKRQGGQEALERLANKQRATAPQGSATSHDTPKDDPIAAALAD